MFESQDIDALFKRKISKCYGHFNYSPDIYVKNYY